MIHLTTEEKRVLLFVAFVLLLGTGLQLFRKTTGCNFCLVDLYSDAPAASRGDAAGARPVDVNTATREELIAVPGIGGKTADAVLRLRAEKGRLTDLAELTAIDGINDRKVDAFRKYLIVKDGPL
ncbi:MAG: ComEA family DNA-binding protein [Deltaproteobacteria bacterium]